jgi:threonine/homoserine/homoserine lactone efflux protein
LSVLVAALLGLGLGVVTGMPLGVINIAIVDAAALGHRRAAVGLGIGGALADTIHAALAFVGIGQLVTARPDLLRILAFAAAALIVAYAVYAWRAPRVQRELTRPKSIATGFLLTLPNPGALTAWVAVAAALWPAATIAEASALAAGVGIGSAAWFAFLAYLVGKLPREHRALVWIPKLAVGALVAIAVVGIVRVL